MVAVAGPEWADDAVPHQSPFFDSGLLKEGWGEWSGLAAGPSSSYPIAASRAASVPLHKMLLSSCPFVVCGAAYGPGDPDLQRWGGNRDDERG